MDIKIIEVIAQELSWDAEKRIADAIYLDYHDHEGLEHVVRDIVHENPDNLLDVLSEKIWHAYADQVTYLEDEFVGKVTVEYETRTEDDELDADDIRETIFGTLGFFIDDSEPHDYALRKVKLPCWVAPGQLENLQVEGGEFTPEIEDGVPIFKPLADLMRAQGYAQLDEGSAFCQSVIQELDNMTWTNGFLVALASITLEEFDKAVTSGGTFRAGSGAAVIGLVDPSVGGGSVMGIELETDWVFDAAPGELYLDGTYGYAIDGVYGFVARAWKGAEFSHTT